MMSRFDEQIWVENWFLLETPKALESPGLI